MRTPLWVAHCVRRIRGLQNIVALQRARRCGLRVAFVASECRRLSLLCSAHAAVGCVLRLLLPNAEEFRLFAPFRCSAMRAPLWAAHCCVASECRRMSLLCIAYLTNITNTTKVPSRGSHGSSNLVAPQCVRRCGLRIAFVASAGFKISSLCSAHAAAGCVLPSSHPNAEDFRCCAVRTPLWVAYCVCCFRMRKNFVSLHHFVALRCARRCGLRIAVSHPNAGECRCSASRTPLRAARCLVASVCLQGMFSR